MAGMIFFTDNYQDRSTNDGVFSGELTAVNRALDDAGFRAEALGPGAQIPHDAGWADRIAAVLGG